MAFNPLTDFLALFRQIGTAVTLERLPGLDYVVAALARAGQFSLFVGQNPPTSNQATTVWLKPAEPSWSAEGVVYLWNTLTGTYVSATPALWTALTSGYSFQSLPNVANTIIGGRSLAAVQRAAPTATAVTLPSIADQGGKPLRVSDWSTGVVAHDISLFPAGGATIMQQTSWHLLSSADQLASIVLYPSSDLNGWTIG